MSKDLDELASLNRDYVASVQNCDVKRFDEILAQDFYCSNPDRSLVDRAGFLKQTAIPVTIKGLVATTSKSGSWATSPSSTAPPAIQRQTASRPQGATPTAGRSRTGAGWQCRRMCQGEL
jgi:hypothetical protein